MLPLAPALEGRRGAAAADGGGIVEVSSVAEKGGKNEEQRE